jgi:hypothetical protein
MIAMIGCIGAAPQLQRRNRADQILQSRQYRFVGR